MKTIIAFKLLCTVLCMTFVVLFLPLLALAQGDAPVPSEPAWVDVLLKILTVAGPIGIASLISAFVPSGSWVMKIIDVLAANWFKARNDPQVQ